MKNIYLDYAASTPVDADVLKAMLPYLKKEYGNPSSAHRAGQRALGAVDLARKEAADFLGCSVDEVVFTSGATEADNLAVRGVLEASGVKKPHIVTTAIEHEAVLNACRRLKERGEAEVTEVALSKSGVVDAAEVAAAVKNSTVLVSVMYVNSEIGTVQPIAEIARMLKGKNRSVVFHTDAVQAAAFLDCRVDTLGVDLLTLSSHKLYGPKGAGLLYVRSGTKIAPQLVGGGQEGGLRSGTENVAALAGMGAALKRASDPKLRIQAIRVRQIRDRCVKTILRVVPGAVLNGSASKRAPGNINVSIPGVRGADLVRELDRKGVLVSTGSACAEREGAPSHVLLALGRTEEEALGAVRITLGRETTAKEADEAVVRLVRAVERLRGAGYNPIQT